MLADRRNLLNEDFKGVPARHGMKSGFSPIGTISASKEHQGLRQGELDWIASQSEVRKNGQDKKPNIGSALDRFYGEVFGNEPDNETLMAPVGTEEQHGGGFSANLP